MCDQVIAVNLNSGSGPCCSDMLHIARSPFSKKTSSFHSTTEPRIPAAGDVMSESLDLIDTPSTDKLRSFSGAVRANPWCPFIINTPIA